jgi:inosine-uridine nucleoside N-ribohydrolase
VATVVLDTDIGTDVDDAIALALLTRMPGVELASVTTVGGQTGIRAALARRLLAHCGRSDVPVAAGYGAPLASGRFSVMIAGGLWLGHEGRGVLTDQELQAAGAQVDPAAAVRQLTRALAGSPQPATLLTIGPLTNLASALIEQPGLARHIGCHVAMGGMFGADAAIGGSPASAMLEYNLNADREACAVVLEAGLNTILVPAELTYRAEVSSGNLARLRAGQHAVLRDLAAMIEIWSPVYRQLLDRLAVAGVPADLACHLHDSVTVLAAAEPELFRIEPMRIDLAEDGGVLTTRRSPAGAYTVQVATDADLPGLCQRVLDQLAGFDYELDSR